MNTRIKIAAGMLAGLVAGVMLVGTAVAAPMMAGRALNAYDATRPTYAAAAFDTPSIAEMNAFMDAYRTPAGSLDVSRMRADDASGQATPPCLNTTSGARAKGTPQARQEEPIWARGRMMGGTVSNDRQATYGMMGYPTY